MIYVLESDVRGYKLYQRELRQIRQTPFGVSRKK